MSDNESTLRPYAWAIAMMLVGFSTFMLSVWIYPPVIDLRLVLVTLSAALSELFRLAFPGYSLSLAYPLSMAAAVLGGPAASSMVSLASSISVEDVRKRRPTPIIIFNAGQLLVSSAAGGFAYVMAGGRILLLPSGSYMPLGLADFPGALFGMIAAAFASWGVNVLLTAVGVTIFRAVPIRRVISLGLQIAPSQIALAFVGFLMAQVLAVASLALPLFAFPLIVAREYYQRYVKLRDAYRDTIRSLIGALEAKDSYTRGHSVRVAEYAAQIGRELCLDDSQLEALEYAALLHDLGKLSLSGDILVKPSMLTASEMDAMRNHPLAGAEMVERIPPLRGLSQPIKAHHEWYDGKGYPNNLRGESIPVLARILSVADAYDAMTTNRSYRAAMTEDAALEELVKGRNSQFDPVAVDAFVACRNRMETAEDGTFLESQDNYLGDDER